MSKSKRKDGKLGFDAYTWLNKVTLDIIGLAGDRPIVQIPSEIISPAILCLTGFNYNFNSLFSPDEKQDELYESIRTMLTVKSDEFMLILQLFFPLFRFIVRVYSFRQRTAYTLPFFSQLRALVFSIARWGSYDALVLNLFKTRKPPYSLDSARMVLASWKSMTCRGRTYLAC